MKRNSGMTLVELLVAMAMVVMLLAAGVPGYQQFVKNNQVSGQAGKLIIALQVARSEAVKRGSETVICPSTDQLTCSSDTNWATGWIIFSDLDQDGVLDGNGTCTTDADNISKECIIRASDELNNVVLTGGDDHVLFQPNGLALNGPVVFTLKADDCEYQQQRVITVTEQGQTFSAKQDCS